jgi:hypothetical protein
VRPPGRHQYRVPIDATSSTVEHFAPGIGVDRSTAAGSARIGLTYYSYPNSNCTATTCQLNVSFISSTNGGTSWSAPTQIAGPISLSSLPNTTQGRMFGDYISTSVLNGGRAWPVIAVASVPTGSTFHVPMVVPTGGMAITGGAARATGEPAVTAGNKAAVPVTGELTRPGLWRTLDVCYRQDSKRPRSGYWWRIGSVGRAGPAGVQPRPERARHRPDLHVRHP